MSRVLITQPFLKGLCEALFHHIGWSHHYKRYVIVEPVCWIQRRGRALAKCQDIDRYVHKIVDVGIETATILDYEQSDHLEQTIVDDLHEDKPYVLVCDNPLLFPYERLPMFLDFLRVNPRLIPDVAGIVHYHVNEATLSSRDRATLANYAAEIKKFGGQRQIGLVVSQRVSDSMFAYFSQGKTEFINFCIEEAKQGRLVFSGCIFGTVESEEIEALLKL